MLILLLLPLSSCSSEPLSIVGNWEYTNNEGFSRFQQFNADSTGFMTLTWENGHEITIDFEWLISEDGYLHTFSTSSNEPLIFDFSLSRNNLRLTATDEGSPDIPMRRID